MDARISLSFNNNAEKKKKSKNNDNGRIRLNTVASLS